MNAAIIGAGSIGGLIDNPKSPNTASHAHAYMKNGSCTLVAICEPNKNSQKEFIKRWGRVHTYETCDKLFRQESIGIVSIATPTSLHVDNLKEALEVDSVRHILCEKPLVQNKKELDFIKEALLKSDKKILINLIRRYNPSFIELASLIEKNSFGKVISFHGIFTKGLLHNGIHMLGVLSHLLGSVLLLKPIRDSFFVECESAEGLVACIKGIDYSLFELEIVFENAKVEIKEDISIYRKVKSNLYENYHTLEYEKSLESSLKHYAANSLSFLLREDSSTCREILKEHIRLHEILFEVNDEIGY